MGYIPLDVKKDRVNHWVSHHPQPFESLLPQNLTDEMLTMITSEIELAGDGGGSNLKYSELLAYTVLILVGHARGVASFSLDQPTFIRAMRLYAHTLHLELLRRQRKLRYSPRFSLEEILVRESYQLTFLEEGAKEMYEHLSDQAGPNADTAP